MDQNFSKTQESRMRTTQKRAIGFNLPFCQNLKFSFGDTPLLQNSHQDRQIEPHEAQQLPSSDFEPRMTTAGIMYTLP